MICSGVGLLLSLTEYSDKRFLTDAKEAAGAASKRIPIPELGVDSFNCNKACSP